MSQRSIADAVQQHRVTIIGSDLEASLPGDLPRYFRNGILIDRRNDTPMEMDAYSIYLAFRALEKAHDHKYRSERKALVDAVTERMRNCGGFWSHGAWTGSDKEIHMRFTAAAIRLLTEALDDELLASSSTVVDALNRHLSFSEPLSCGTWFLHDSLEKCGNELPGWSQPVRNVAWGSSPTNCLVLNTHVDTLVTVLHVLKRVEMNEADRRHLVSKFQSGLAALKTVLSPDPSFPRRLFGTLDGVVRSLLLRTWSNSLAGKALRKAFFWLVAPIRQRLQSRYPGYVFPDGYIERDIGLSWRAYVYHLFNVWDLAKFLIQYKESGLGMDLEFFERCEELIDNGIDYATRSSYWRYVVVSMKENAAAIVLCEAILARLGTKQEALVAQNWMSAYCAIRRILPPSPAILGYDALIVNDEQTHSVPPEGWDFIRLRDGRTLAVDWVHDKFIFGAPLCTPAAVSGTVS
jgi:hypothetical protein